MSIRSHRVPPAASRSRTAIRCSFVYVPQSACTWTPKLGGEAGADIGTAATAGTSAKVTESTTSSSHGGRRAARRSRPGDRRSAGRGTGASRCQPPFERTQRVPRRHPAVEHLANDQAEAAAALGCADPGLCLDRDSGGGGDAWPAEDREGRPRRDAQVPSDARGSAGMAALRERKPTVVAPPPGEADLEGLVHPGGLGRPCFHGRRPRERSATR